MIKYETKKHKLPKEEKIEPVPKKDKVGAWVLNSFCIILNCLVCVAKNATVATIIEAGILID